MKQYRNLMIIIVGICLCFSTFYINKAFSTSDFPEYSIQKVSGDENILKNIKLEGFYNPTSYLTVTNTGSEYDTELSFFRQIDLKHSDGRLDSYREKYPSFMRGKIDPHSFIVNKNQLMHVDLSYKNSRTGTLSDFAFKVSALNTKTKESTTFKLPFSNQKNLRYSYIEDVRLVNNTLKVITANEERDNDQRNTFYNLYSIDLETQKLIKEDRIGFDEDRRQDEHVYYSAVTEMSPFQDNEIFLYEIVKEKLAEDGETTARKNDFYLYNLRTQEHQPLKLTADIKMSYENGEELNYVYDDQYLYISKITESEVEIISYDMNKQEIAKVYKIPVKNKDNARILSITDNRIVLESFDKDTHQPSIQVYDIQDGKPLFNGSIEIKNKQDNKEKAWEDLSIHTVTISNN